MPRKGLKQVGDVHRNAHLHTCTYFTLMCNSTTYTVHFQTYSFIGTVQPQLSELAGTEQKRSDN